MKDVITTTLMTCAALLLPLGLIALAFEEYLIAAVFIAISGASVYLDLK